MSEFLYSHFCQGMLERVERLALEIVGYRVNKCIWLRSRVLQGVVGFTVSALIALLPADFVFVRSKRHKVAAVLSSVWIDFKIVPPSAPLTRASPTPDFDSRLQREGVDNFSRRILPPL